MFMRFVLQTGAYFFLHPVGEIYIYIISSGGGKTQARRSTQDPKHFAYILVAILQGSSNKKMSTFQSSNPASSMG